MKSFLCCLSAIAWLGVVVGGCPLRAADVPPAEEPKKGVEHARELMAQRRYEEAKQEFAKVVEADVQTLGAQDPKTLSDRLELAIAQGRSGDSIKAEDEMRSLLAIFERRRGPDQDETLNCRTALARLLDDLGRPHEAVKEYRLVVDSRERLLGADDIEVARVRHLLADGLAGAHDYAEAIAEFRKAEPIFERVLGVEHAETLLNRSNLALAEGEHQEYDASEKELKELLAIRERQLGQNDVSVLMTCYNLARVLGGHKRFEEALSYATRAAGGLRVAYEPSNILVVRANRLCTEIQTDLEGIKAPPPALEILTK